MLKSGLESFTLLKELKEQLYIDIIYAVYLISGTLQKQQLHHVVETKASVYTTRRTFCQDWSPFLGFPTAISQVRPVFGVPEPGM